MESHTTTIVNQIPSEFGTFQVIGACGGDAKCDLVRQRGIVAAIDYNTEDMTSRVKDITQGQGVDIVFDNVGGKLFDSCIRWYVDDNSYNIYETFSSNYCSRTPL